MAQIQTIRFLHEVEGWSQRRIARELHVSRKTIAKCLDRTATEEPKYIRKKPIYRPKMGPYEALVGAWLEADEKAPRKQRHTARRIFERLQDEYGADVAESTVRAFVAKRRAERTPKEAFLHLSFPAGESAQVDWGEVMVTVGGERQKVFMFCMRLCYSTAPFVMLFPSARMECFLEGHVQALEYFGGVPRRIIYDNLRSAVTRILYGRKRELNSRFQTLKAHYLFDAVFANPGAGWEKGLVEDLVGVVRRQFFVPVPEVGSLEEANEALREKLLDWRSRPCREQHTVGALWDEERPQLMPLPPAFRASTTHAVKVSNLSTIQFQQVRYSVPAKYVGRTLHLEAYHDRIEVYDGKQRAAVHTLRPKGHGPVLELDHYLDVLQRKPGAVRHARVVTELGLTMTAYRDAFLKARPEAYREFVAILLLSRTYTLPAVLDAVAAAHERRIYDVDRVEALMREALGRGGDVPLEATGPEVQQTSPQAYDELVPA